MLLTCPKLVCPSPEPFTWPSQVTSSGQGAIFERTRGRISYTSLWCPTFTVVRGREEGTPWGISLPRGRLGEAEQWARAQGGVAQDWAGIGLAERGSGRAPVPPALVYDAAEPAGEVRRRPGPAASGPQIQAPPHHTGGQGRARPNASGAIEGHVASRGAGWCAARRLRAGSPTTTAGCTGWVCPATGVLEWDGKCCDFTNQFGVVAGTRNCAHLFRVIFGGVGRGGHPTECRYLQRIACWRISEPHRQGNLSVQMLSSEVPIPLLLVCSAAQGRARAGRFCCPSLARCRRHRERGAFVRKLRAGRDLRA